MSLEDRLSDALDAAGRAHDRPADLLDGVQARIERERRSRRAALLGGGVAALAAAAALTVLLLNRAPDSKQVRVDPSDTTTTTSTTSTTVLPGVVPTPTTAPAKPTPPAAPKVFVGLVDDTKIVVAEPATGRVVRTLYTSPERYGAGSPVLDPSGQDVYYTTTENQKGMVWKVPVVGGTPKAMFPGCAVQVSPDGRKAAVVGGSNGCREGITVHDLGAGTSQLFGRGSMGEEEFVSEAGWTADSTSVVFTAAPGSEMPGRVFRFDIATPVTLDRARKLGPAGDTADSWSSPQYLPGTSSVKVIEYCCMVDAEPPPSDSSDVVVIDAAGKEIDRWRTPQDVESVTVAANGSGAELYLGNRGELYRREGDTLRKLTGTWSAIDW